MITELDSRRPVTMGYRFKTLPPDVREPWARIRRETLDKEKARCRRLRIPWTPQRERRVLAREWAMTEAARALHRSRAPVKVLVGGYGSGKSYAGCAEAAFLAAENRGCRILVISPTYILSRDIIEPTMEAVLEDLGLRRGTDWTFQKTERQYDLWGGWRNGGASIILRSADKPERMIGINAAAVVLDEPSAMRRAIFALARRRVRDPKATYKCIVLCGTPDVGSWLKWLYETKRKPSWLWIEASTDDNPWMDQEYIDEMMSDYDERTIQAYRHGKLVSMRGTAYHAFSPEPYPAGNIRPWKYDPKLPVFLTMDNNREPLCGSLAQEVGGTVRIFAEFTLRHGSWGAVAEQVALRLGRHAPPGFYLHGDPVLRGKITDVKTDWGAFATLRDHLAKVFPGTPCQLRAEKGHPFVIDRLEAHNALLCNAHGERRLFIDPSCIEVIRDHESVEVDEDGGIRKPGSKGSGVDPDRTHHSDAIGYMICKEWPPKRWARARFPNLTMADPI